MSRIIVTLAMGCAMIFSYGHLTSCSRSDEPHSEEVEHREEAGHEAAHHGDEGHGHHEAHHGGFLNVIGEEAGHIEIRLEGDVLEAWFVGGGDDTNVSVPIEAQEIRLEVAVEDGGEYELVLKADPMKLAGEEAGHCSHFVAQADWLEKVEVFHAEGQVEFKGIPQEIVIEYPGGYDPMHGHGDH